MMRGVNKQQGSENMDGAREELEEVATVSRM